MTRAELLTLVRSAIHAAEDAGRPRHEAALAAIEAAGCVVVPREATREMLGAMYVTPDFCGRHIIRHSVDKLPEAYRAMLAASPYAQEPKA